MPVTADSFLWEATGFFTSASSQVVVPTHPDAGGTTAGSSVVVGFFTSGAPAITRPSEFAGTSAATPSAIFVKSNVAGGETSWSFTVNASTGTWYMAEFSGDVSLIDPEDGTASATSASLANAGTLSSGSASNAGSGGVALAFFHSAKPGTTDVQSWSGYTNSFAERLDVSPASGSIAGRTLAVAWKTYDSFSSWSTTATFATSGAAAAAGGRIMLLRAADATINAPLRYCTTFGFGTHAGMAASTGGTAATSRTPLGIVAAFPAGTWGTNYSVGVYGRDGRTGLEVSASASIANVRMPSNVYGVFGGNVKAVSGSGTPVAVLFSEAGSGQEWSLLYDVTNEKFGLQWSGGTTVWQTGTTPVGTFAWVDVRARINTGTWHLDWAIETGTGDGSQTSPTDLTHAAATGGVFAYLGSTASQTAVFRFSDIVASTYNPAYPLGPHIVRVISPSGTGATVSGTAANFNRFTANGTLAAVNGTEGALLDDIPPTISASSDGVVQVTLAATEYIEIPMDTYTLASDEIIAGVRAFASLWGGTGTGTGTLGFRGWDGTSEDSFVSASTSFDPDSLTTASSTYPLWYADMWALSTRWTQAKLDATALRGGFSTDATPDMGFSCMGLEVATRTVIAPVVVHRLTDDEDPEAVAATVTERLHPYTSGVRIYTVSNNDVTRTAAFNYSIGGTPQTPVTVAPGAAPVVAVVAADVFGEVDSTSFGWQ